MSNFYNITKLLELYKSMGVSFLLHETSSISFNNEETDKILAREALKERPLESNVIKNNINLEKADNVKRTDIVNAGENVASSNFDSQSIASNNFINKNIIEAFYLAKSADNIEDLIKKVEEFNLCKLKKTAMNTVFCSGNLNAKILVVKNSPDSEEDKTGVPFTGKSSEILFKALQSVGLKQEMLFCVNSIFWRPPGNREQTVEEVMLCFPFLVRLIEILSPQMILFLGNSASRGFLSQDFKISDLRGHWYNMSIEDRKDSYSALLAPNIEKDLNRIKNNIIGNSAIICRVVFDPQYLFNNPLQKKYFWLDLLEVANKAKEIEK